ncbi:hypothetical protein B0H15DRAFT_1001841 [Mycena belliarum]|uniref:Uncharacterized protein n=1 Tax=Mycena belliarum TaxID=1033014 RepID=A0AAD6UE35_9AGAR|nr:hypothetical protein B0H15DRAFT_1001841 [Mycena belliae]
MPTTNPCIRLGSAEDYRLRRAHSRRLHRNHRAVRLCGARALRASPDESPAPLALTRIPGKHPRRPSPPATTTPGSRVASAPRTRPPSSRESRGRSIRLGRGPRLSARESIGRRRAPLVERSGGEPTYRAALVPSASSRSTRSLQPSTPALRAAAVARNDIARSLCFNLRSARQSTARPRACTATRPASVRDSSAGPEHAPCCPLAKRCSVRGVPERVRIGAYLRILSAGAPALIERDGDEGAL